jgi:hypothetical protein
MNAQGEYANHQTLPGPLRALSVALFMHQSYSLSEQSNFIEITVASFPQGHRSLKTELDEFGEDVKHFAVPYPCGHSEYIGFQQWIGHLEQFCRNLAETKFNDRMQNMKELGSEIEDDDGEPLEGEAKEQYLLDKK